MFSIACAIGTGLVIGSGTALSQGGPGSLLIAYLMVGGAVFFVMTGLGEMAAFLPMNKGFGGYASRMVDPAFGCVHPTLRCGDIFTDTILRSGSQPAGIISSNTSSRCRQI
jgi:amino acid permease